VKIPVFFSRASIPVLVFRLENPIYEKIAFLSFLTSVLAAQAISAAANGVTYKVRLENGVDQYYLLEVPPSITPVKLNPGEWNQPQYATDKISPNAAVLAAVGWAGGLEDHDSGGPPNSLTNLGGKKPGGFYHASHIKVGDVQYRPGPFPNYLVHLNGQIGQTRQSFYADVLEDGRIVRPVPVSAPGVRRSREHERANPEEKWGGAEEKMKWGGAEEKKKWGGSGEKKKWGGAEEKKKWGGSGEKKKWGGAEEKKKWGGSEEKPSN
jgi:hypothetical protein